MAYVVGREKEIKELYALYGSNQAELVAVYGRRRIGKTFLVDQALAGKITFRHAGLSPVDKVGKKNLLSDQLKHFYHSLLLQGMPESHIPTSWLEAFFMLSKHLQDIDRGERQVVFLDELPWMDTPRSGFLTAFEGFWNSWACHRDNVMVVVCGSASSWILDKLINNHGGLYGRTTHIIKLSPFTLGECELFFKSKNMPISRYDIIQSYMIFGGVPYYLNYFEPNLSLSQNVDRLIFAKDGKLRDEYDRLFTSIFTSPEEMKDIVDFVGKRHSGYTRKEIAAAIGVEDSGNLSDKLRALVAGNFLMDFVPYGESMRSLHYKLVDPFCRFCQTYIKNRRHMAEDFWTQNIDSPSIVSWRGIAFEEVCLNHIVQIKKALGISGVSTEQSAWIQRGDDETEGTQIDLIIKRKDNIYNLCEMKFYSEDFTINKSYHFKLVHRKNLMLEKIPRKGAIHSTLITTYGLTYNEYSGDFVSVVTMDSLFK
ncbi:MAG: ATP-binding protein [Lepagella sp.]